MLHRAASCCIVLRLMGCVVRSRTPKEHVPRPKLNMRHGIVFSFALYCSIIASCVATVLAALQLSTRSNSVLGKKSNSVLGLLGKKIGRAE